MVRKMTEGIVNRFLSSAKAEMIQKNETEIRCPCRRCKLKSLMDPNSDTIKGHLLMRGFMDGYRWQGDEDDYEVVLGGRATVRNNEGQQGNGAEGGPEDEESPRHDHDAGHNHHVEDDGHDDEEDQDEGHDHEDEDAGADNDGPSMGWVQDPHLQELLTERKPSWINLR